MALSKGELQGAPRPGAHFEISDPGIRATRTVNGGEIAESVIPQ